MSKMPSQNQNVLNQNIEQSQGYLHELSYEVEKIMDTPEGQADYKKRSKTAESHNGTFRRVYHL